MTTTIFSTQETFMSFWSGREYSRSTILEVGNDYYRKDNQGPHTKEQICEMYAILPTDYEWIINMYKNVI